MEDKKFLKVVGKRVRDGNTVSEATAVVPYVKGTCVSLPNVPPFNTNVWLDGDTGYNMSSIEILPSGEIHCFYSHYYDFTDGKIHAECGYKADTVIFDFELTDSSDI